MQSPAVFQGYLNTPGWEVDELFTQQAVHAHGQTLRCELFAFAAGSMPRSTSIDSKTLALNADSKTLALNAESRVTSACFAAAILGTGKTIGSTSPQRDADQSFKHT